MLDYGSVCSGIEAPGVALGPLGYAPQWFSETAPFPSAVLAHHYPDVTNAGDLRGVARQILRGQIAAPAVLIGGTPCQAFSLAGYRAGLADPRGALALSYLGVLDAIDFARDRAGQPGAVAVWEQVPGVLGDSANAFGCFLGGLVGESRELVTTGGKWANAGLVFGPRRTAAWRVLDAQYFGLAQHRRRLFVVASSRNGVDPAAVLFERGGVRGDSAPARPETDRAGFYVCPCGGTFPASAGAFGCPKCKGGSGAAVEAPTFWNGAQLCQTLDASLTKMQTMPEKSRFPVVLDGGRLRFLTPLECERLQGLPDNYTRIVWKGKPASECPDAPRYRAIGNSIAPPMLLPIAQRLKAELIASASLFRGEREAAANTRAKLERARSEFQAKQSDERSRQAELFGGNHA